MTHTLYESPGLLTCFNKLHCIIFDILMYELCICHCIHVLFDVWSFELQKDRLNVAQARDTSPVLQNVLFALLLRLCLA